MHTCWTLESHDPASLARAGWLTARDGARLPTPLFQPVATAGSLRTLDWADLRHLGYRHALMNTYHLVVSTGWELLKDGRGIKRFTGWGGSVLTDSGGYQAFSLGAKVSLRQDGVRFTDPRGGQRLHFTPRFAVEAQLTLGVDFAMCLDVCTGLPAPRKRVARDMELTHAWATEQAALWGELKHTSSGVGDPPAIHTAPLPTPAVGDPSVSRNWLHRPRRSRSESTGEPPAPPSLDPPRLFGIVQGGLEEDLRRESVERIGTLDFDGLAVGGLAVGEAAEDFKRVAAYCGGLLCQEPHAARVHYLMGLGEPADLLFAVAQGYDMFDCVQPTRMARHGVAFTRQGKLTLRNARFAGDERPLDPGCRCRVCRSHSRAYLRHLLVLDEHSYARLLTLHNLAFYHDLLSRARRRIVAGTYGKWWPKYAARLGRPLPEGA